MFCPQSFKLLGNLLDCSNVQYFQKFAPFNLRRNDSSFFYLFDVRQPSLKLGVRCVGSLQECQDPLWVLDAPQNEKI